MQFDLVDLSLFVNIAEDCNLTHGAERSHMSLSAASMRIKNIEDRLGARLLYRNSHGVSLTPMGDSFLHNARIVLQQLQRLQGELQEYVQGAKGHVRLFANTTAITEFLPRVLSAYLASHPNVNVDLREHLSHHIVRAVTEGITDIGIAAGNVHAEALEVIPYRTDRLVVVTALVHPLTQRNVASFQETLAFEYISLLEETAIHGFLNQAASSLGRSLKTRILVGNFEALCRMVEANVGIGVLPETIACRFAKTMKIWITRLQDEWAVRNMQICVRNLASLPVFAKDLIDLLIADRTTSNG